MAEPDLSSWKDIARFLGVSVRTAQLWEKQRNLPVRRVPGGQRGSVRASPDELRQWLAGMPQEPEPETLPAKKTPARWAAAGMAVLLMAAAGWVLVTKAGRRQSIAKAEMHGNTLAALDSMGKPVWTHTFSETPVSPRPNEDWTIYLQRIRWQKDAAPELVAAVQFQRPGGSTPLTICFGAKGEQRWSWEPKVDLLDFNGEPFEKYWVVQHLVADESGKEPVVWASVANPLRWASALYRLDSQGRARLQFSNAGSIMRILRQPASAGGKLLAAGVNNAWEKPFLAEIDPNGEAAFSPPSGPDRYHFANGPKGLPKRYFLLPQTEITRLHHVAYAHVSVLTMAGDHVLVETITGDHPVYIYEFDSNLRPVKVRTTASGINRHKTLEQKGLVDHTLERCPEVTRAQVLKEWTAEGGWRDHTVPVASPLNRQ